MFNTLAWGIHLCGLRLYATTYGGGAIVFDTRDLMCVHVHLRLCVKVSLTSVLLFKHSH